MTTFRLTADAEFIEAVTFFGIPCRILSGSDFERGLHAAQVRFENCFSFNPLFSKQSATIRSAGYRMKSRFVASGFYIKFADDLGGDICIIHDNPISSQKPNTMFVLPRSSGVAASLGYNSGNDHICFNHSMDFLIIVDTNSMLVGYGRAEKMVISYRNAYPEFFVL